MAFVRKVITGSGATAVQIVRYHHGGQQVLRHVGSAHDEAELGLLLALAHSLLVGPDQLALDFDDFDDPDITAAPVAGLLSPPAGQPELIPAAPEHHGPGVVGASRVVGTTSEVLYRVLVGLYDELGFGVVGNDVFRDLVIARVVEPTSLFDSLRVLADLGARPGSYPTLRRVLKRVTADGFREKIAQVCFDHASTGGDISLLLYDVTTLYFEAEKEDDLRKVGYSKERRVDPQIVVGLLVDRRGYPLEISCFEGNKAETSTLLPVVEAFMQRHGIEQMAIVADAGMLSASNLRALDDAGMRFIVGSRMTKAPTDLASHFRWHGDAFTDGQIVDTITPKTRRTNENNPKLRAEPEWQPETHPASWRAIWAYSHKRAQRDERTLKAERTTSPRRDQRHKARPTTEGS